MYFLYLKMVNTQKKQVHIAFSKKAMDELEELKKELGLSSISDVIRSSVSLTKFISLEKNNGNEIIIRDKKNKTEKIVATLR